MSEPNVPPQAAPNQGTPDGGQPQTQTPQTPPQGGEPVPPQGGPQQFGDQGVQQPGQPQPNTGFDPQQFFQQQMQQMQTQQAPQQTAEPQPGQQPPQNGGPAEPQDGQPQQDAELEDAARIPEHWTQYKAPEGTPEVLKLEAHKMGLTQQQFEGMLALSHNYIAAQEMAQKNALRQQAEQFIQEKWGEQAEYKLNIARRALRTVDKDGSMQQMLDQTGYGNHPQVLDFFYKLGENLKEGGFLKGELNTPAGKSKSPAARLYPNLPTKEM